MANPKVFFDMTVDGQPAGRIVIEVSAFSRRSDITANNGAPTSRYRD
jgi:hypothetical protein